MTDLVYRLRLKVEESEQGSLDGSFLGFISCLWQPLDTPEDIREILRGYAQPQMCRHHANIGVWPKLVEVLYKSEEDVRIVSR